MAMLPLAVAAAVGEKAAAAAAARAHGAAVVDAAASDATRFKQEVHPRRRRKSREKLKIYVKDPHQSQTNAPTLEVVLTHKSIQR